MNFYTDCKHEDINECGNHPLLGYIRRAVVDDFNIEAAVAEYISGYRYLNSESAARAILAAALEEK